MRLLLDSIRDEASRGVLLTAVKERSSVPDISRSVPTRNGSCSRLGHQCARQDAIGRLISEWLERDYLHLYVALPVHAQQELLIVVSLLENQVEFRRLVLIHSPKAAFIRRVLRLGGFSTSLGLIQ
jgi:hypothetical protein